MSTNRVVIGDGDDARYLLARLKRDDQGRVIQGYVVNGQWGPLKIHYDKIPDNIKESHEFAHLLNPGWTIEVPDNMQGDYNDIMYWAEGQPR